MEWYRALLRLYPKSFREDYGREMTGILRRESRHASARARFALYTRALVDVLANAPAVHWEILKQDLRYTVRTLTCAPLFSATVVLVATLGIGATTAAFTLADHVLVRPLPFFESDRLVKLWQTMEYRGYGRFELSPGNYRDWKAAAKSFESMAAYNGSISANLVGAGDPIRLEGARVTGELFALLRAEAALGRVITPRDDEESAPPTVLLSDWLWRTRFGANPNVIGRSISLDDRPYTVIGVMPPAFQFPSRSVTYWAPFQFAPPAYEDRTDTYLLVIARMKPGVTLEQARAEMTAIAANLALAYPDVNRYTGANVVTMRDDVSRQSRLLLLGIVAASAGVLLIACVNLANLLLARALTQQRELAVRAALGAGRDRLVRQLFTETAVLSAAGGLGGIVLVLASIPFVARLVPTALPIADTPAADYRMLAVAALMTVATALGFGMIPAIRAGRHADASALRDGQRTGISRRTERLRAALVVAEVTASMVLLVSSGLLARALWKIQQVDPGFRSENVLTLRTTLPMPRYIQTQRKLQFYNTVLDDVRALPGVEQAAYMTTTPLSWKGGVWAVSVDGEPEDPSARTTAILRMVTPNAFRTLGISLRRGRDFTEADSLDAPLVAVVSDSFVRVHWPGLDPIGRRLNVARRQWTVVGVVGDVKFRGLERESEPQVYLSPAQFPDGSLVSYAPKDLLVRSAGVPPTSLLPAIREIIARADPQQPISDVQRLSDAIATETAPRRVQVRVLAAFAAVAFLLAGVGLHGLLAFNVSAQARDIGVRLALGAERRRILTMVIRHGLTLTAIGLVLGTVLSWMAGRALQGLLAGVSPMDAATVAGAVALSLSMTLVGCLMPAFRATRIDPIAVIRSE